MLDGNTEGKDATTSVVKLSILPGYLYHLL